MNEETKKNGSDWPLRHGAMPDHENTEGIMRSIVWPEQYSQYEELIKPDAIVVLRGYPGNCELELAICLADGSRVVCKCESMRLSVNPEMQSGIDQLLGPGNLRLLTSPPPAAAAPRGNGWARR
jgi:hypothetical protein